MVEEVFSFEVSNQDQTVRLDLFLKEKIKEKSRTQIQKDILLGAVTIDGELPVRASKTKLTAGMSIEYTPIPKEDFKLEPEEIPLDILYEDEDMIALNKASGMVVHPAPGHLTGTLVHALMYHLKTIDTEKSVRPGIVHRLDQGTTGLILVAKNEYAHEKLSEQFQARSLKKEYIAFVKGIPKPTQNTIQTLYGRDPFDRKKFSSKVKHGKRAITEYHVEENFLMQASKLRIILKTGRTHQIRVHLKDLGHPLLGDETYGRKSGNLALAALETELSRPALHAFKLRFSHPRTTEIMELTAPIPQDLIQLETQLQAIARK